MTLTSSSGFTGTFRVQGRFPCGTGGGTTIAVPVIPGRRYFLTPDGSEPVKVEMNGLCPETPIIQVTGGSVQVQCSPAPAAPSNVQARLIDWLSTTGIVHVTWNDNGNETGFTVERSADAGMNFQPIGTTEAGAGGPNGGFVDWVGLGTYVYRVRAIGTLGESAGANSPPITIGPTSPPTLTGTLVSATRIDLSWTALTNATAAILYRSADGGAFTELMALTLPANGFSDTTTAQNHTYAYRLDVSNPLGVSSSNVVVIGTAVPPAPTDVWTTVPSQTSAQVNWTYTLGTELGFRIQRAAGTGAFSAAQTLLPGARSYLDGGRASGQALRYRLWAFNNVGDGPFIEVSLNMAVPAAPTGATADILSASQVRIRWTDTSLNENDFIISRQVNGGTEQDLRPGRPPGLKSSSTRAGVSLGARYTYRVRLNNAFGSSTTRALAPDVTLIAAPGPGGQPGRRRGRPTGGREPDLDQRICQRLGDPSRTHRRWSADTCGVPAGLGGNQLQRRDGCGRDDVRLSRRLGKCPGHVGQHRSGSFRRPTGPHQSQRYGCVRDTGQPDLGIHRHSAPTLPDRTRCRGRSICPAHRTRGLRPLVQQYGCALKLRPALPDRGHQRGWNRRSVERVRHQHRGPDRSHRCARQGHEPEPGQRHLDGRGHHRTELPGRAVDERQQLAHGRRCPAGQHDVGAGHRPAAEYWLPLPRRCL